MRFMVAAEIDGNLATILCDHINEETARTRVKAWLVETRPAGTRVEILGVEPVAERVRDLLDRSSHR